MEGFVFLLCLSAVVEICHQWKEFQWKILPWISFLTLIVALLQAVSIGLSLDVILIVLLCYMALKLLPYWSRGHEL